MSKTIENFYEFICAKLTTLLGSKIPQAQENDSFAVSCTHLELSRECKKEYMKVGESRTEKSL